MKNDFYILATGFCVGAALAALVFSFTAQKTEHVQTCYFAKGQKQMRDQMFFYDPMQQKMLQLDTYKPSKLEYEACGALGESL